MSRNRASFAAGQRMSIRTKVIKSAAWSVMQNWGSYSCSLIIFFLLARLLTPEDFGIVALANSFVNLLQILLSQGFAQALIQREVLEDEHLYVAFWINVVLGILLTLVTFLGAPVLATILRQPLLADILQILSITFVIVALARVQQALLERAFAFRTVAIRSLLAVLVSGGAGIAAALNGWGAWSIVVQTIVYELVGTLTLWTASSWRPKFRFSIKHCKELCDFGVNVLGADFLAYINNNADDLLIGLWLGPVPLGYYTIAYRILTVMTNLLIGTSQQVALPTFSRLLQDPERFQRAFYGATQLTSLIAFPSFLGTSILAPELITLFFGEQWLPSTPVLQVLAFVGILRSITYFKGSVFLALGKPSWKLRLGAVSTSLNLIGFIIAVRWGIVAVSVAYLCRAVIIFPIGQWLVSRLIKIPLLEYLQQFLTPLISSLIMSVVILLARNNLTDGLPLPFTVLCLVMIGMFTYVTSIRILDRRLFFKLLSIISQTLSKETSALTDN